MTPWGGAPRGASNWDDGGEDGEGGGGGGGATTANWPSLANYPSALVSSQGRRSQETPAGQMQQQPQQQQQQQHPYSAVNRSVQAASGGVMALLQSTESPRTSLNIAGSGGSSTFTSILEPARGSFSTGAGPSPHLRASRGEGGPQGLPPPSPGVGSTQRYSDERDGGGYAAQYQRAESSLGPDGNGGGGGGGGGPVTINELEMQRRLKETQGLLSRFSEENNRLAKENDKLVRTRTVGGWVQSMGGGTWACTAAPAPAPSAGSSPFPFSDLTLFDGVCTCPGAER